MKKTRQGLITVFCALAIVAGVVFTTTTINASEPTEQQLLIDQARITFQSMIAEHRLDWLRDNFYQARGVMIIPRMLRAGFFLGGSGGRGVLLVRDADTDQWSQPAFYTLGSGSIGFQIGGDAAEVIMMIRTQEAVNKLLASSFKLGGEATVTAGPVGQGVKSNVMADIYTFSRTQGLFGGVALEGAVINTRDKWNIAYYGQTVTPTDIMISNMVSNPGSAELREAVTNAARKK